MIILGLLYKWRNRETKAKLRKENKWLKEQLLNEHKSEIPRFEQSVKIKKLMSTCTRRYRFPDDKHIRENLAIELIREIENYLIINKTFDRDTGCENFTATLYIADYKDSLSNDDWCNDEDVNIIG